MLSGNGNLIAVGAYDKTVRILNHITWRVLETLRHDPVLPTTNPDLHIYFEEECTEDNKVTSNYGMRDLPITLPESKPSCPQGSL
jgi:hypothetical protein